MSTEEATETQKIDRKLLLYRNHTEAAELFEGLQRQTQEPFTAGAGWAAQVVCTRTHTQHLLNIYSTHALTYLDLSWLILTYLDVKWRIMSFARSIKTITFFLLFEDNGDITAELLRIVPSSPLFVRNWGSLFPWLVAMKHAPISDAKKRPPQTAKHLQSPCRHHPAYFQVQLGMRLRVLQVEQKKSHLATRLPGTKNHMKSQLKFWLSWLIDLIDLVDLVDLIGCLVRQPLRLWDPSKLLWCASKARPHNCKVARAGTWHSKPVSRSMKVVDKN